MSATGTKRPIRDGERKARIQVWLAEKWYRHRCRELGVDDTDVERALAAILEADATKYAIKEIAA